MQDETNSFFMIPVLSSGTYRLVVKNEAYPSGVAANFNVSAFADSDNDGMPDVWETAYGFSANSPDDATLDFDGDGVPNRAEYIAGTDPTDPESKPRIESIIINSNMVQIKFTAVSNRTYTIEYVNKINDATWEKLADFPALTNTGIQLLSVPLDSTNCFYRLVTPRKNQ